MTVTADSLSSEHPAVRRLETLALAVLLATASARCFMAEAPFRSSQFLLITGGEGQPNRPTDECIRVSMAMVLLAGAALWGVAQLFRRRVELRGAAWLVLLAAFVAASLFSALRAADPRAGLDGWLEQAAILLAGWVMVQLAADRRRFALVAAVLAALGATLAVKAIYQSAVEIPVAIAEFQENVAARLAEAGAAVGDSKALMLQRRLLDPACHGYFGLSNVFASLLLVVAPAAVGVVVARIAAAIADRRANPPRRGEVHLPTLVACMAAAAALLGVPALLLTRSKGGIAGGVLAAAIGGLFAWKGRALARRWRLAAGVAAGFVVAAVLATVAWGMVRGGLPTRSLQVRWEYWIGAARLVAERPLLGVGPGNFGDAYLAHRLPAAAEGVKTAHNVIVDAVSAYGLPGGAAYLVLLVWMLLKAVRPISNPRLPAGAICPPREHQNDNSPPRERGTDNSPPRERGVGVTFARQLGVEENPRLPAGAICPPREHQNDNSPPRERGTDNSPPRERGVGVTFARKLGVEENPRLPAGAIWILLLTATVLVARLVWTGRLHWAMVLLEGIVPAGVLVAMLLLMFGSLRRWGFSEPHARLARGALSAGLLAFAAHNFLEHTLWMPATATVFWIAAGASAGVAARPQPLPRAAGAVLAAALVVAAILAGWLIWRPVWRASALTLQARAQWSAGQAAAALASLDRAVDADPRDGTAAADLARAALSAGLDRDGRPAATRAATAAELAACRQPSSAHAALLATARWYQAEPSEMLCAWRGRMGDLNVLRDQLAAELLRRPDNIPLASALAEILHLLGQDEAAYSLLKSALDRSGKVFPKALDHLGDLAFWTGRAGEAHAAWGQYLSTSPGLADPPARNAAVAAMTQAVAMDPMSARLRMDLAEMLCALGRPADAAAQADRAAALDAAQPPDSDLRLNPAEHARLAALKAKIAVGKR